ncbi:Uncharacterized protein HZ326_9782 [Fusarium oxysporum f. sp. albedinis]|nr:Uncharacterized protein HZ326_9782 [Fusarium oxysporum f. sp. albedinis]
MMNREVPFEVQALSLGARFGESLGNIIYPKPRDNLKLFTKMFFLSDYPYIMTFLIPFTDRVDILNFDGFPADTPLKP